MGIELERALERRRIEGLHVVPILIRECDVDGMPLRALQWLPSGDTLKPVKRWSDRDAAWTNVAKGIRALAEGVRRSAASAVR
ncbi:MAG TPA: hypothetical protein VMT79_12650 [Candidatus Binatia bacterium]|nr:hypothetical protein [Candidatus Binatia bacterium]